MAINKEFWDNRVRKYGHTGWKDYDIYAYDQCARLKAIEKIIDSLDCQREFALDFGTGVGDFANLLAQTFNKVYAFDISQEVLNVAKKKYGHIKNINFIDGNSITDVKLEDKSLDIILSITVLDHILDDNELSKTIGWFGEKISDRGYIVILEYALPSKMLKSDYQRYWLFDEWLSLFSDFDFHLIQQYGFNHPKFSPCKSYSIYNKSWQTKFFRLICRYFGHIKSTESHLDDFAERILREYSDFLWKGRSSDILKIMIYQKS
ncbi:MAG: class I SAM-dependent methyltransferase [Proteobacteria bacterium]|nr:class I SAM-dependent methyltransferase [Pseudomonadota bacterium]